MCGFDFSSNACEISIKMRKQKGGCQPEIRCSVLPVLLTFWVMFRISVHLIQPLVSYVVSYVVVPFAELDLFLMRHVALQP